MRDTLVCAALGTFGIAPKDEKVSRVVNFRAEDPLYAQLHEFAQRSSLSEGQAARYLVEVGLGKSAQSAAISTYMRALSARLKSPIREAVKRISRDLERFAQSYGGEMEFERVEPIEDIEAPPPEEEMTPEEAGESGMFDREPEPEPESRPTQGLSGTKQRRRGRRGGRR